MENDKPASYFHNKEKEDNNPAEKQNPFWKWIKNNILATILLIILIAGGAYLFIRMNQIERRAENERRELVSQYEQQLDSMGLSAMERTVKVLSWAVRSEMARQNMEQVNQFFSNFIREHGVQRIILIDPGNGEVILSTDMKDMGTQITDADILRAEGVFSFFDEAAGYVISPVMGLDARLGVLIVEFRL